MPDVPLDGPSIRSHLEELAERLGSHDPRPVLLLVGGSLLAWQGLREATADVDTVVPLAQAVREAAATVAHRHGLDPGHWLNDRAAPFAPATLHQEDCEVLLDHPGLLVLGAPLEQVFLMKLSAHRARDFDDLVALWPRCSFESPEDAARQYAAAYPHETEDEYLADFIRVRIAGR